MSGVSERVMLERAEAANERAHLAVMRVCVALDNARLRGLQWRLRGEVGADEYDALNRAYILARYESGRAALELAETRIRARYEAEAEAREAAQRKAQDAALRKEKARAQRSPTVYTIPARSRPPATRIRERPRVTFEPPARPR